MLATSSFNSFSLSFFIVHICRQLFKPLRLIIHSQQQFSLFMRNEFEMKTFEEIYLSTRSKSPNRKMCFVSQSTFKWNHSSEKILPFLWKQQKQENYKLKDVLSF